MQDFNNKVAFVTGAASGIGLGMTKAFVRAGMRVMMADIESKALSSAAERVRAECSPKDANSISTLVCDVSDLPLRTLRHDLTRHRRGC